MVMSRYSVSLSQVWLALDGAARSRIHEATLVFDMTRFNSSLVSFVRYRQAQSFYLQNWHFRLGNMTRLGGDDFINNTIIHSFFCRHEEITVTIRFNFVLRLIAVLRNVRIKYFSYE